MSDKKPKKTKSEFTSDHKAKSKNDRIKDYFLVTNAQTRANGQLQLLTLKDREGTIRAVRKNHTARPFDVGSILLVVGHKDRYNDQHQITIETWRVVPPAAVEVEELYSKAELERANEAMGGIREMIASMERDDVAKFCDVLIEELGDNFKFAPAAISNHHADNVGLAVHTLSMMREASDLVRHYNDYYGREADRDVVLAGVLVHDCGKAYEMGVEYDEDRSIEADLLGHIVIGAMLVSDIADDAGLGHRTKTHLTHIVISHHNKKEWGAPVSPKTQEAWIVHLVDMVDSRLGAIDELKGESDGRGWSPYSRMLNTQLYEGDLNDER